MSQHSVSRYSADELQAMEDDLASLSLDDFPLEDEPSRVFEGLGTSPETLAHRLMGQVVYQITRRLAEHEGMTKTALADRMGVPKSQVSRLLKAQKNTTLLTVARAAVALGLTDAVLKLLPSDADQLDEVKAFVEAEGGPWWPLTERAVVRRPITVRTGTRPDAAPLRSLSDYYARQAVGSDGASAHREWTPASDFRVSHRAPTRARTEARMEAPLASAGAFIGDA